MSEIQKEIEAEFGEPFWDVVRGFADDGYTIGRTGIILGYSGASSFRRLVIRHGKQHWFANGKPIPSDSPRKWQPHLLKGSKAVKEKHSYWMGGVWGSTADHAKRLGVNHKTVQDRMRQRKGMPLDWYFRTVRLGQTTSKEGHAWKRRYSNG